MTNGNSESLDDEYYLPLVLDTQVGARFEDNRGQYQLDVVTINKTEGVAYRTLRLKHLPSGQVTADPWQQGQNMAGNAKLLARCCKYNAYKLTDVITGYLIKCTTCQTSSQVEYLYQGSLSRCPACKGSSVSLQEITESDYHTE